MFNINETTDQQQTSPYNMYHGYLHQQYYQHQTSSGIDPIGPGLCHLRPESTITSSPQSQLLSVPNKTIDPSNGFYTETSSFNNHSPSTMPGMMDSGLPDYGMMYHSDMTSPRSSEWSGSGSSMYSDHINMMTPIMNNNENQQNFYNNAHMYCKSSTTTPTVSPPHRPPHFESTSSSREQRNRAEKMRRDKINKLIIELGKLVPLVFNSPKRVDKTSILRLTSTYLRIKQFQKAYKHFRDTQSATATSTHHNGNNSENGDSQSHCSQTSTDSMKTLDDNVIQLQNLDQQQPTTTVAVDSTDENIPVDSVVQLVCDQLGGFLMVLSTSGKIIMVSQMIETLMERSATDLMGQSIYDITHADDHHILRHQLSHNTKQAYDETGGSMRRNFSLRVARNRARSEPVTYESVSISGVIMPNEYLICIVKVRKPAPLYEQLLEARKDEYVTRHLVDGRIINCDQRISVVAGYMTEEVAGLSAFRFMHREDVRWTMIALRQMYDRGESRGSSCYRLMTRTGDFIYLRTCGYLEVDSHGTVESFVCVNTLVTEAEGQQLIRELKQRYSALIQPTTKSSNGNTRMTNALFTSTSTTQITTNGHSRSAITASTESVEDPKQLEVAIQYLMHKLPGSPGSPESKDCFNNNNNSGSGSDSSPPTPKRQRTESPHTNVITSSSTPDLLPPEIVPSPQLYTHSTHAAAAISLDRQIRKEQELFYQQQTRNLSARKRTAGVHHLLVNESSAPSSCNNSEPDE